MNLKNINYLDRLKALNFDLSKITVISVDKTDNMPFIDYHNSDLIYIETTRNIEMLFNLEDGYKILAYKNIIFTFINVSYHGTISRAFTDSDLRKAKTLIDLHYNALYKALQG